ncbi:MAG: pitrilysin family protein [Pseudomonadales bacterium]
MPLTYLNTPRCFFTQHIAKLQSLKLGLANVALLSLGLTVLAPITSAQYADAIDIPYERYELDNGLTLLVHEDRKAPIVTVNIWYHVGSKDERPGITGFAHLFEHLMFNGSENYNDEWFLPLQKAGGTDLNGTTWFDRTNYFQNVPTPALDMVLWMESDRMGHFINAVTQERLDEQRDVVKNEKRQGDNRPYGKAQYLQLAAMFPQGHPYSWSTIGSLADLDAASLDDVKQWFAEYYGAANATLVVAGDISGADALEKVKHYFGDIEAGPSQSKRERWVAKHTETRRDVMYDKVPQSRLTRAWNTPPFGDEESLALDLVAAIMAQGKSSRLFKRLVYQEKLASSVTAAQQGFEIAGMFELEVYLKPDVEMAVVEAIIDEELELFLKKGPSKAELQRVKATLFAGQIRALEKIGGFGGKAQTLARYQTYLGDPSQFKTDLQRLETFSRKDLKAAAVKWLSSGDYNLEVHPEKPYTVAITGADRSVLPSSGDVPSLSLETPTEFFLSNGLRVLLSSRGAVPVTEMAMQFNSGYAADKKDKLGLASMTAAMLDEGTDSLNALEIAEQAELLGANIAAQASLDSSTVSLSALNVNLDASLALFVDILLAPAFPDAQLARVKSNWQDRIAQEESTPSSIALRRLPPILYGTDHPYGIPFTGSGYQTTVASIERSDLLAFHEEHFSVDNATLMIVGATSEAEIKPLLEAHLGGWKNFSPKADVSRASGLSSTGLAIAPSAVPETSEAVIYLIDKPGSPQSLILGGQLLPATVWPDTYKLDMASEILGGSFTSRINMNLREDKGWAYGARTITIDALGARPLLYYAPVQSDKTAESLRELLREANEYGSSNPPNEDELSRFKSSSIRSLPGKFETNAAVLAALAEIVAFNRPLDYLSVSQQQVSSLTIADLLPIIDEQIHPEQTIWLVVGDLETIEDAVRAANIAPVIVLSE